MLIRTTYVWDVPCNDYDITADTLAVFQGSLGIIASSLPYQSFLAT